MNRANSYFEALAWKRLKVIDLPNRGSNQHELQGISPLRAILGEQGPRTVKALWRGFDEDSSLVDDMEGELTWYDARADNPNRASEWRLYFKAGTALERARIGDLLLVAKPRSDGPLARHDLVLYVLAADSDIEAEVIATLALRDPGRSVVAASADVLAKAELLALHEDVLRTLEPGFRSLPAPPDIEEAVRRHFSAAIAKPGPEMFPKGREMACFAQSITQRDPREDPDGALIEALDNETNVFRALENVLLAKRVAAPFPSVQEYLKAANSDLNRRKARRGNSFENHLAWVFRSIELPFEPQIMTEPGSKVDFLFPGAEAYERLPPRTEPGCGVTMLGLKTRVRERWRQVLRETRKLSHRYLGTLDLKLTASQVAEMAEANLEVVIPKGMHAGYGEAAASLLSVNDFIGRVREELRRSAG